MRTRSTVYGALILLIVGIGVFLALEWAKGETLGGTEPTCALARIFLESTRSDVRHSAANVRQDVLGNLTPVFAWQR